MRFGRCEDSVLKVFYSCLLGLVGLVLLKSSIFLLIFCFTVLLLKLFSYCFFDCTRSLLLSMEFKWRGPGSTFVTVHGLLTVVASLVADLGLKVHRLSGCSTWAEVAVVHGAAKSQT